MATGIQERDDGLNLAGSDPSSRRPAFLDAHKFTMDLGRSFHVCGESLFLGVKYPDLGTAPVGLYSGVPSTVFLTDAIHPGLSLNWGESVHAVFRRVRGPEVYGPVVLGATVPVVNNLRESIHV